MELNKQNNIFKTESPVESLSQYIEIVNKISYSFTSNLWFRGHSKGIYKNIPSIYREGTWIENDFSHSNEHEIYKTFKRKCVFRNRTDYEYLHLMQHYGLPTRLLDWTESSLIALFFAIHNPSNCDNPCVWVIDPWKFNRIIQKENTVYFFYGDKVHPKIIEYLYPKDGEFINLPTEPAAVQPSFYDERVIAQKSGFILFGRDQVALEELVVTKNFDLAQIEIKTEAAEKILIDLAIAGIDYHSIFPDTEGLVKEIKRRWELR